MNDMGKIKVGEKLIRWMRQNPIATGIMILYGCYGVIRSLPPHASWFDLQTTMITIGTLIVGVVEFPFRFLSLADTGDSALWLCGMALIYFIAAGAGVGILLQKLWRKSSIGKIVIFLLAFLNGMTGCFIACWSNTMVTEQPDQGCEQILTQDVTLRIRVFEEVGILSGNWFFYLVTSDGGRNWEQLMTVRNDDPLEAECTTFGSLENQLIWIWSAYGVRTSWDGGETWNAWDWQCCTYGAVEDVTFQDAQNGTMTVYPWRSEISELTTHDGGLTWDPQPAP